MPDSNMTDNILSVGITNIFEELLQNAAEGRRGFPGCICHLGDLDFACILTGEDGRLLLRNMQEQVQNYLHVESFGVAGPVVEGFWGIQESFDLAYGGLQQQFRFSPGSVVSYEVCGPCQEQGGYTVGEERLTGLCACVNGGDLNGASDRWQEIWTAASSALATVREIRSFCMMVCSHVFLDLGRHTVAPAESALLSTLLSRLETARYSGDFLQLVDSFFRELASVRSSKRVPRRRQIVEEVQKYVRENIEANLSIRDISAQVFLAPTYLCTLFKEETGSTINAYVTRQRMQYAARMLSAGQYRVYELARLLGYTDVKYFSSLFKRYLGQTPSRYAGLAAEEGPDERE